jgi:hypothetical protein
LQRWYEQQQETTHTVPQTTGNGSERRYDTQTMHKAVEIAARMQAEHQETLTAQEIEAIATEAGIDPRFIQRALEIAETETAGQKTQQVVAVRQRQRSRRRLSRKAMTLIFGVPLLYFVFALPMIFMAMKARDDGFLSVFLILVLPFLVTLISAANLRRTRQGAVLGFLMGIFAFLAPFVASLSQNNPGNISLFGFIAFCFVVIGTVLGAATTWVRRCAPVWLAGHPDDND